MPKMRKNLILLALAVPLIIGVAPGETQIIENITPQEAFALIQDNKDNPDFVILDVRSLEVCSANFAIIDVYPIRLNYLDEVSGETHRDKLGYLDKNKVYLIYDGHHSDRSAEALAIMEELGFREVYNILGGIHAWEAEGLPVGYLPISFITGVPDSEVP